jgi:hypothetical protein
MNLQIGTIFSAPARDHSAPTAFLTPAITAKVSAIKRNYSCPVFRSADKRSCQPLADILFGSARAAIIRGHRFVLQPVRL